MNTRDVPSPIDLRQISDAREWADSANLKRPWREEFFAEFSRSLVNLPKESRVLELGSGPGFLAQRVLESRPDFQYVALDFSEAMHLLALERLGESLGSSVKFVARSFLDAEWFEGLGNFSAVITNQSVHELRHKSRASLLHKQVRSILDPSGFYLVCDHFAGEAAMQNNELYMSVTEQSEALKAGGFSHVIEVMCSRGMVMHRAEELKLN